MSDELSINFANLDVWVELPDDMVERMWNLVRAVAAGHGDSGMLQAEAVHLKQEIDLLVGGVLHSKDDNEGERNEL